MITPPDYEGGSLVNLVAEIERRMTGDARHPGLHPELASEIPDGDAYVLVLFDGLGDHQLAHPSAAPLLAARRGVIDAGWPTTTTVSMATVATGLTPAQHGLLGYQMWIPELERVVNTIKWTTQWGEALEFDRDDFLPSPNLWERLSAAGVEPVTLQPWNFDDSPMSQMLYRGCRFEPWSDEDEAARIAAELAIPGRFVFFYIPHVDFAAHVGGQQSDDYAEAMSIAAAMWDRLAMKLPPGAVAIGTADHGHVDVPEARQRRIPGPAHDDRNFGGDPRAPFVYGEYESLATDLGVEVVARSAMEHWWGPGDKHAAFADRAPDAVLLPEPESVIFHKYGDERLIGQHGGLTDEERQIPLLVATGS
jgi:hypothetical protein